MTLFPPRMNQWQRWFVQQLLQGRRCGTAEIMRVWQASPKTARGDIAALKARALIEYVGSRRKERYRRI